MNEPKEPTVTLPKETYRIEAFSDAVFAIAITLLVLDLIDTLHSQEKGHFLRTFLGHWQSITAFTIGFITILVCWINHHLAFEYIRKVDTNLMWLNGFLLFLVTLVPFSSAVLAEYLEENSRTALAVFGFNYFLISIAATSICSYPYRRHFIELRHREIYLTYIRIYRYSILYTFIAFLICFISNVAPVIMYLILFSIFAAPKEFALRLDKWHSKRKRQTKKTAP